MIDRENVITLATASDTHRFRAGAPLYFEMSSSGGLVAVTGWRLMCRRICRKLTAPFRIRYRCVAVDAHVGTVTMVEDRAWYRFLK